MNAPDTAATTEARRARSRRLAFVLALLAVGFYAAFIYTSYLRSHR
jgi:hypothetical protein